MKAFGERLKQAREAKAITIRSVAAATRIRERYLTALEQSDLDALPGRVFDKGYIKSYAQYLDIDPAPLLESYDVEARKRGLGTPQQEREKLEELARLVPERSSRRSRGGGIGRVVAGLLLVSLVGAIAWWIFSDSAPDAEPDSRAHQPKTVTRTLASPKTARPQVPARGREVRPESRETSLPEVAPVEPAATLSVQVGVGTAIVDRNLVGRNDRFPDGSQVWCWTRIVGGSGGDTVRHVWRHEGAVHMSARLPVGGSHWRTYSTLELPRGSVGEWTVDVVADDGTVLDRVTFSSVSPAEGT